MTSAIKKIEKYSYTRRLQAIFAVSAALIILGGVYYYNYQQRSFLREAERGLRSIAVNKANRITAWRERTLAAANQVMYNPFLNENMDRWLADKNSATGEKVSLYLRNVCQYHGFSKALLIDTEGMILLSVGLISVPAGAKLSETENRLFRQAVEIQKPVIGRPDWTDDKSGIEIDIAVPLYDFDKELSPLQGGLIFSVNPNDFLYPMIQSWPDGRQTGEAILFEADGNGFVLLSPSRFKAGNLLRFRVGPEEQTEIRAIRGQPGIFKGLDYRGVEVVTAVEPIPESAWWLEAKMDYSEIRAAGFRQVWIPISVTLIFLAIVGLLIGWTWQSNRKEYYRTVLEAELEHLALVERFEYLVKYANDIFILTDERGRILEVNDKAVEIYGYTRDEITKLAITDLVPPDKLGLFKERFREIQEKGSLLAEGLNQKKDGSVFNVEYSVREIFVKNRKYYQGILRDITERKRAEEALKEREILIRSVGDGLKGCMIYQVIRLPDGRRKFTYISGQVQHLYGCSSAEAQAKPELIYDKVFEADRWRLLDAEEHCFEQFIPLRIEVRMFNPDGSIRWSYFASSPHRLEDGSTCWDGIELDISERHQVEDALRESEERYRNIVEYSAMGVGVSQGNRVVLPTPPC